MWNNSAHQLHNAGCNPMQGASLHANQSCGAAILNLCDMQHPHPAMAGQVETGTVVLTLRSYFASANRSATLSQLMSLSTKVLM